VPGSLYPEGYQNPESSRCPGGSMESSTPVLLLLVGTDTRTLSDDQAGPDGQALDISFLAAMRVHSSRITVDRDPESGR